NNASEAELKGKLDFDLIDPDTQKSVLSDFGLKSSDTSRAFSVAKGGGTNLVFKIKAPAHVGLVSVKATARAGDASDGELRPLPLLPGRFHLAQSRFVTLKDKDSRVLEFKDLSKTDDPSRINEGLVVTLDAQLFYSVLTALPYLVKDPYECVEQTLNR